MEVRRPHVMVLPEKVLQIADAFASHGYQLYVVGGAVRDAVLGLEPKDYDLATNATPEQVTSVLFGMLNLRLDETGRAFGVMRAKFLELTELCEYEIATFREDMSAGRHPEVRFATIVEDVQRRDLTINALFYDIERREVVDLVGGLEDIENRVIRTVGRPEDRFQEDRLRILRAIRFAARFGWKLEAGTSAAIMRDNNLDGISGERIRDEFVRGLASAQYVRRFLSMLDEHGMWLRMFPGLRVATSPDVMVSSSGIESRLVPVALAVLLDGNPVAAVAKRLNELKYSAEEIGQATFLMRFRDLTVESAYKLRRQAVNSHITDDMIIEYCGERGMPSISMLRAFINYELSVTGDSLLQRGLSGAELGRELERLETVQFRRLLDDRPRLSLRSLEEDGSEDEDGDG